jgi:hypothetical protein
VDLARKNPDLATDIIATYIKEERKLVESVKLSSGTLDNHIKPIKVLLDHGFRKYFNTMMRRAKVNFLDEEDMMGHKVGLEKHYERYQEEDLSDSQNTKRQFRFSPFLMMTG